MITEFYQSNMQILNEANALFLALVTVIVEAEFIMLYTTCNYGCIKEINDQILSRYRIIS